MGDYIPTYEEVRQGYVFSGDGLDFKKAADRRSEEFELWLAEHDAEVIRQYRITDYRKRAANADYEWKGWGDSNDRMRRDFYNEEADKLEKGGN